MRRVTRAALRAGLWGMAGFAGMAQAAGLVALGSYVAVQPAGDGAPVVRVQASMAAAAHGEQLQLQARTPIDSRLLILPASAAGELQAALAKARQWSQVAKDNGAEVVKPLACIGPDPTGACTETGAAIGPDQLGLIFTATDGGATSALLATFKSGSGGVQRSAFYLTDSSLAKLAAQLDGWPQGLKQARTQQRQGESLFN